MPKDNTRTGETAVITIVNRTAELMTNRADAERGKASEAAKKGEVYTPKRDANLMALNNAMLGNANEPKPDDGGIKRFKVQFNPSSLELTVNTHDEKVVVKIGVGSTEQAITQTVVVPDLTLTIPLIYDHVLNQDAFTADKLQLSANSIVGNISNIAKKHTVQTEVEGFLAMIQNPYTRTLRFQWGEFSFEGTLEYVDVKYVMFSPKGQPIRANVQLRLKQENGTATLDLWGQRFRESFGDGIADFTSVSQKVGSILNI